jgi:glycosyltransferase involved in cell wall biosynthesis
VLLAIGRIDPVKNQGWLVERAPAILLKHPEALLVLAGACTDESYGKFVVRRVEELGLQNHVLLTGGLPPGDPRLIGLMQEARVVILPSISETFGLVLLEAWAAGAPVLSSRTSGASALIQHGENGWLFDLADPQPFHEALDLTLLYPDVAKRLAEAGRKLVAENYDIHVLARRVKTLYEQLIEDKHALRHPARR